MFSPTVSPIPKAVVLSALGIGQILSWGATFYLIAVLAEAIRADTGWDLTLVVSGLSVGLLVAGICSPRVGRLIGRGHGRIVLVLSALSLSLGLALVAVSPNIVWYLTAWSIVGLGMSGGLYNAAFAVLGHVYGASARSAITLLTLFGGFASSLCWPLSTLLVESFGWRWAVALYAAALLLIVAPLYGFSIPNNVSMEARPRSKETQTPRHSKAGAERKLLLAVALVVTFGASIAALVSAHMFTLLAGVGISGTQAVALAALVGPSQVAARLIEMLVGRKQHPLWTMLISSTALAIALYCLGHRSLAPVILIVIYGVGIGLGSIANGTVPLAIFGAEGYAIIMGRIALPSLLSQAAAPVAGALLIQFLEPSTILSLLALAGVIAALITLGMLMNNAVAARRETARVPTQLGLEQDMDTP